MIVLLNYLVLLISIAINKYFLSTKCICFRVCMYISICVCVCLGEYPSNAPCPSSLKGTLHYKYDWGGYFPSYPPLEGRSVGN